LAAGRERLQRRYYIKAQGYDFNRLADRVAQLLDMQPEDVLASGKHPSTVKARSLLCFWATRELGITMIELSQKLRISQPAISVSAKRGEKIAAENGFNLLEG
jgi:putative transposase